MRFGRNLQKSVYEPWKAHYIDYAKCKKLLREDEEGTVSSSTAPDQKTQGWTEADESAFTDELLNVQLDKVNDFYSETVKQLRENSADCERRLEKYRQSESSESAQDNAGDAEKDASKANLTDVLESLDRITKEVNELEKYSRLNYAGFLKAAKKHDRRRGSRYQLRPLLQVRLAALPFNSEDYSPLLYRWVPEVGLCQQYCAKT